MPRCHPPNRANPFTAESRSHSEQLPTRYAVRASRRASSGLSPAASNCGTERSKAARRRSIRRDRRRPRRGVESSRRKRRSQANTRADSLPDPRDGQRRPRRAQRSIVAGVTVTRSGLSVGAVIRNQLRVPFSQWRSARTHAKPDFGPAREVGAGEQAVPATTEPTRRAPAPCSRAAALPLPGGDGPG